jgi:branched-chain amino acid transport system permease protein
MTVATSSALAGTVPGSAARSRRRLGLAGLLVGACVLPFFLSGYHTLQLTLTLAYAIAVLGLNILTGYNGQISLGHGAFYAIGGYVTAILMVQYNVDYWATVPIAAAICLAVGFLFGLPALRLDGLYLALATFALAVATPQLLKYKHFEGMTGGVQGIFIPSKPVAPFGLPLSEDQWLYFFSLGVSVVMFVIARNLLRGRIGRAIVAIRDNPTAAETMGINNALYKSLTFGVSALFTGVAGSLGAIAVQFVAPDSYDSFLSIRFLVGVVIGGLGSISGAVYGGFFVEFLPNISEQVSKAAPLAISGIVVIAVMFLMPTGIAGFVNAALARILRRGTGGQSH